MSLFDGQGPVPVGDLSSPFLRIQFFANTAEAIKAQTGEPTPNDLNPFKDDGDIFDAAFRVRQAVREVLLDELEKLVVDAEIVTHSNEMGTISLSFSPPFEDAVQLIEHKAIQYGTVILLQWGYSSPNATEDRISRPYMFVLQKPEIEMETGNISIKLRGTDVLGSALGSSETRRAYSRIDYPNDFRIINRLVSRQKLALDVSGLRPTSDLYKTRSGFGITQTENDWTFFHEILRLNKTGFFLRENKVVLYDEDDVLRVPALYRFVMADNLSGPYDIPIISFKANVLSSLYSPDPLSRTLKAIATEFDTNEVKVETYDAAKDNVIAFTGPTTFAGAQEEAKTIVTPIGPVNTTPTKNVQDFDSLVGRFITVSSNESKEAARQLVRRGAFRANVQASITCLGVPFFTPHINVLVNTGVPSFDGLYLVMGVTHNIGSGGYTMSLDLVRNDAGDTETQSAIAPRGPKAEKTTDIGRNPLQAEEETGR